MYQSQSTTLPITNVIGSRSFLAHPLTCLQQMDDIDAMFSDLLGEMDLLTQVSSVHTQQQCLGHL